MQNLQIEKSKSTLEVDFNIDAKVLKMAGSSYPENPVDFFQPIFDWLKNFIATDVDNIQVDFRFDYLNTSSTKCIINILDILEDYHTDGGKIDVNWYYEEDDEDILETGEEIFEDIELPVNYIEYEA